MKKRKLFVVAGILVVVAAIFFANRLISGSKEEQKNEPSKKTGQVVEVIQSSPKKIQTTVDLTGRLIPAEKIDIYTEVQGVFRDYGKPFKTGITYRKGEVLLDINADEIRQAIISQKANFKSQLAGVVPDLKIDYPEIYARYRNYLLNIDMNSRLAELPEPETEQQKLFLIGRNIYTTYHQIRELESRLNKFTIYAPYDGTLTETYIHDGSLVRPNMRVGEFVKDGAYELEAAVLPENLKFFSIGQPVRLSPTGTNSTYEGTIARINAKINQQTQTIKVFIDIRSNDLHPGLYMEGEVKSETFDEVIKIQRDYLVKDNHILVVEDSIARLKSIELKKLEEEYAIVSGVDKQTWIIAEDQSAALEGQKVSPIKKDGS